MLVRIPTPVAVALATLDDLPGTARTRQDAERRVSRIAARRAIQRLAGGSVSVDIHRRTKRPPVARVRRGPADGLNVALGLTHRDGRAAAIAAPSGSRIGIDIEHTFSINPTHQRYFLTANELHTGADRPLGELWALKEAAWKALQLDGSVGFHELQLEFNDNSEVIAVSCRGIRNRAVAAVSIPWSGYVMAAVVLEPVQ